MNGNESEGGKAPKCGELQSVKDLCFWKPAVYRAIGRVRNTLPGSQAAEG